MPEPRYLHTTADNGDEYLVNLEQVAYLYWHPESRCVVIHFMHPAHPRLTLKGEEAARLWNVLRSLKRVDP